MLEAVGYDLVYVRGSWAQEELLLDWQGVFDGIVEAFGDSLYPEDVFSREVDKDVLDQLTGQENGLHRGGCGCFFGGRHVFD